MQISVEIKAPELANAIQALAEALNNSSKTVTLNTHVSIPENVDKQVEKVAEKIEKALVKDEKKEADKPAETEAKQETKKEEPEAPAISLEVVRGKLAEFSAQGKPQQMEVRKALDQLGAKELTGVDPKDYKQLLDLVGLSV
ncbi:hypothetical protein [Cytobacillus firmus]|uniref:hypothetical protein n=1 Tax=Cytobacillus firmus TaxID=1399 RepID=UPI0018CF7E6F|nr:hypothetical protein [Cytobacillus firmus]MBG9548325.1 hypothetical protein [Cytobacillus firmus]MBG9600825.1 hypothetical protein [Cytobacillus firmus]MED1938912.1 hypothetical protein [Cytobacillus firmus]